MSAPVSSPRQVTHHIASFDGIRGVAVLMVLIGHAGHFNNGWMGVDLFFVLSGFLITGILRRSRTEPFYWRRFYLKRATRILPPLILGITAVALLWPQTTAIALAGYLLSLGNVVDLTRYDIRPLEHLWSLSVEEHFYLFWPLAVLWLRKPQLQKLLLTIVIFAPLARLVTSFLLPPHSANPIYYLTPFRIDGIALGSLLALLLEERCWEERLRKWSGPGAVAVLAIYLGLWTVLGHIHFFPYAYSPFFNFAGYSLVAVIAFCVVAYARLRSDAVPTRLLRNPLLTGLGAISYGAYVYSWIILQLIRHYFPQLSVHRAGLIHIIVSVPAAAVIFRYYERPITMWGKRKADQIATQARMASASYVRTKPRPASEVEDLILVQRESVGS